MFHSRADSDMRPGCFSVKDYQSHSAHIDCAACRKALQLLRELVRQRPQDIREALKGRLLGTLGSAVGSDQAGVREAALALLALLVQHPGVVTFAKQVRSALFYAWLPSLADCPATGTVLACLLPLYVRWNTAQHSKGSGPWTWPAALVMVGKAAVQMRHGVH